MFNRFKFHVDRVVENLNRAAVTTRAPKPMGAVQYIETTNGFKLDPWQLEYIEASMETSRIAIAACRQSGKSTVTAGFAAWFMTYNPGVLVLIASKSLRQAAYFIEKIRNSVLHHWDKRDLLEANKLSITLPNGATAVAIPCQNPDAGRGFSPNLVILDEAAFAAEELLAVITPSLAATGGALQMISSPNGPAGFFYEAVEGRSSGAFWHRQVTHHQCPRIGADFLAAELITLGELRFKQEYLAQFLSPEGAFFGYDSLNALFSGEDIDLENLEITEAIDRLEFAPSPDRDDLVAALDRTDRVRRTLYD